MFYWQRALLFTDQYHALSINVTFLIQAKIEREELFRYQVAAVSESCHKKLDLLDVNDNDDGSDLRSSLNVLHCCKNIPICGQDFLSSTMLF